MFSKKLLFFVAYTLTCVLYTHVNGNINHVPHPSASQALLPHAMRTPLLEQQRLIQSFPESLAANTDVNVNVDVANVAFESSNLQYDYDIKWFTQFVDHFEYDLSTSTFQQRYLVSDKYWKKPKADGSGAGPIFFYTGNEADITLFANNTGFMWELAPEYDALVVFMEHRYYGESLPFGVDTFNVTSNLRFLSSEQALADYAWFLTTYKAELGALSAPVISFGGSYGGMLSGWFRMKYPNIVHGAIAASAPIWQFTGLTAPDVYSNIISDDFLDASQVCGTSIKKSWDILSGMSTTKTGLDKISSNFKLCKPLANAEQVTGALFAWLNSAFSYMAMADYPYPSSFLGPMPGYPINVSCTFFSEDRQSDADILTSVYQVMNLFYNYTGEVGSCFNVMSAGPSTLANTNLAWNYQSCTEMVLPVGQGHQDILNYMPWNYTEIVEGCKKMYGITPRPTWIPVHYTSKDLTGFSNIVFSNGNLDPWHGGGVLESQSDSVVAVYIMGGAHHLDLRHSNPLDPPAVTAARNLERQYIDQFLHGTSVPTGNELSRTWVGVIAAACTLVVCLILFSVIRNRNKDASGSRRQSYSELADPIH
jgi:lysosomal Pro-X carboxypeptidase